jgi:phosphoribosylformylglycinamidine cyclo-ligase
MWRVFNCGIGMVAIVARSHAKAAAEHLRRSGETIYEIGSIEAGAGEPEALIV